MLPRLRPFLAVNRPPLAINDSALVPWNSAGNAINVLANDSDSEGSPLAVSAVSQGAFGTVLVGPGGANVLYTPSMGFAGIDSFTYTVTDGSATATGTVTVIVAGPTQLVTTLYLPNAVVRFSVGAWQRVADGPVRHVPGRRSGGRPCPPCGGGVVADGPVRHTSTEGTNVGEGRAMASIVMADGPVRHVEERRSGGRPCPPYGGEA